jgi:glycosyltransferase involved in cell wall biosynthesis
MSPARKQNLLLISPVMPAPTGNGLAMRAGTALDVLASQFAVHLLVIPVAAAGRERLSPFVRERTVTTVVDELDREPDPVALAAAAGSEPGRRLALSLAWPKPLACRFATRTRLERLKRHFQGLELTAVHVMRLYMVPYAAPFLESSGSHGPAAVLDMDEDEVGTCERLAALRTQKGELAEARLEQREAQRFAELERTSLGRFAHILVSSPVDLDRIGHRLGAVPLTLVPNAVDLPSHAAPAARRPGARRILFVGTFGYLPNEDAALFLCHEVLPLIWAEWPDAVHLQLVGPNPPPSVTALRRLPGVQVMGAVADLGPCYRDCDLVVVPIRAGGGTRIKLLEAMAHARPVVATRIGAEGLAVKDRTHLLLADQPQPFARACLELLRDPDLALSLGLCGRQLVQQCYARDVVARSLTELYRSMLAGRREESA